MWVETIHKLESFKNPHIPKESEFTIIISENIIEEVMKLLTIIRKVVSPPLDIYTDAFGGIHLKWKKYKRDAILSFTNHWKLYYHKTVDMKKSNLVEISSILEEILSKNHCISR